VRTIRLGDAAAVIRGVTFDGGDVSAVPGEGLVPILRAGNISERLILDQDLVWVPRHRVAVDQFIRIGDVAICLSSGSPAVVGKSAGLEELFEGSVGAFCGIIRPGRDFDPQYLALWFRSPDFWSWRDSDARGASIQNLRVSSLADLPVQCPPLEDQRRIAARLTEHLAATARARASATAAKRLVGLLRNAAVDQALNSVVSVNRVPLGELGTVMDGDWILNADYAPAGVRLLQVGDIGSGVLRVKSNRFITAERAAELGCTLLRPGDLLISRMADPIGRTCILPDLGYAAITAVDVTIFRPREDLVDRVFLNIVMNSRDWLRSVETRASGATRPRISRKNLESLVLPVPPLRDQKRVVTVLGGRLHPVDDADSALAAQLAEIDALWPALLRRAFGADHTAGSSPY